MPMLKEELSESNSVEQRIVNASLRCVDKSQRAGVETLFCVFGCFAEDEVVPASALEVIARIICERAAVKAAAANSAGSAMAAMAATAEGKARP